ncbi:MAG: hypothetical protein JWM78_790 [Verrucomicrobiaceae bacterium]|nr:hypothetical protein [Verrucomicrobiaceae bacterium]
MTVDAVIRATQLRELEEQVREQWRLGQNIVLCWCAQEEGIYLLVVPHYYLGRFSASLSDTSPSDRLELLNGRFIRQLISSKRLMSTEDFFSTAHRLELEPMLILSPINATSDAETLDDTENLIKRYSISYVDSRAVLLFDIVDFSLHSPFEQTTQLNSLSYSLNSAYNKLLKKNIKIDFARTTTGDGFYVWNRNTEARASLDLFQFMLLVIADNAIARRKARGNTSTVPLLRTAFHIGSHFEFYQVEGVNPTLHSYIVGDVTIELARMVEIARPGQIFIGEFKTTVPTSLRESAFLIQADTQHFVERVGKHLEYLQGLELSGENVESLHCQLTGETGVSAGQRARRFRITDKHGRSRHAFNLRINIHTSGGKRPLILGIQGYYLPKPEARGARRSVPDAQVMPRRQHRPRLLPEQSDG